MIRYKNNNIKEKKKVNFHIKHQKYISKTRIYEGWLFMIKRKCTIEKHHSERPGP